MGEQGCDPTPFQGRRGRRTVPGSGLALCGFDVRGAGGRPFARAVGLCAQRPVQRDGAPEQGQHPDSVG